MRWRKGSGTGERASERDSAPRRDAGAEREEVRRSLWRKLRRNARHVPFAEDAVTAYYAAFDRDTPLKVRATLVGSLLYFVLPADAVPDVVPMIGFTDDATVLLNAFRMLSAHIKPHHRTAARGALESLGAEEHPPAGEPAPTVR